MKKLYTLILFVFAALAVNAQCSELFISEYAEGSSNNKYLEIYNPTASDVDLSNYSLFLINNGGTANNIGFDLSGTLASREVYILAANQADSIILSKADTALSYNSVCHFNGDDAVMLLKGTDTIDQIGVRWQRKNWTVGTGSTKDYTLVRKATIEGPDTAWTTTAVNGWDVLPKNDWTNLGTHTSNCDKSTEPSVAAADPTAEAGDVISLFSNVYTDVNVDTWRTSWSVATLEEFKIGTNDIKKYSALDYVGVEAVATNSIDASGMEYFTFDAWTPDATTYRVKLVDFGADNAYGGGDDKEHEIAFENQTQGSWNNHKIDLVDFSGLTTTANISQIIFSALPAGSPTVFIDNVYFSRDKVLVYKDTTIAGAIMLDSDLAPTNEGELYELTGTVYGIDFDGNNGLSFTIMDETGGINIFNWNDVSDYVVTAGDEITARGEIDFYNGLLELKVDSIKLNSQGNTLAEPTKIYKPSEETESKYVRLRKVWVADTTTVWPNNGNVWLTNQYQDTFQVRIDKDAVDIVGTPVLYDTMTINGIGGQFDNSAPYDEGYQVFPTKLDDIEQYVYDPAGIELVNRVVSVYPNPAQNKLTIKSAELWNTFEVYNLTGVKVLEGSLINNTLNVSALTNGSYVLRINSSNSSGVSRFVVTH